MNRVSVVGCSGSGKTRLARALAGALGVPWLELDAVNHQPGWQPRPLDEFRSEVAAFCTGDRWVVDGNYSGVQDLVWRRADTVVWLDLPRHLVMRRIVLRTAGRALLRRELWNGNRESLRDVLSRDPQRSIVRWAWTRHPLYRERYEAASRDPGYAGLAFVRLTTPGEVGRLLSTASAMG